MALVLCPECGKKMSQHADTCLECGFPIKNFMIENRIDDLEYIKICPICGEISGYAQEFFPVELKCPYCNITMVQTDIKINELNSKYTNETYEQFIADLANKFGDNQFSQQLYDQRQEELNRNFKDAVSRRRAQPQNTPKCPTCGSTNIQKIGTVERGASILSLGIFSKKINKTYKCKNCGLTW